MATKYIARYHGQVVGKRTTKDRTYTHALVVKSLDGKTYVPTWCGSLDLARKASTNRAYVWNAEHVEIVPTEVV